MSIEVKRKIVRKGLASETPVLQEGEFGFQTDVKKLLIGASGGNKFISFEEHQHTKSHITDFAHEHTKSHITDFAHEHTKSHITDFAHTHNYNDLLFKPDLGNANAVITLWVGTKTITAGNLTETFILPFSGLKNCLVEIQWDSVDFQYGLQTSVTTVQNDGTLSIFVLGQQPEVWFTLQFTDTQVVFSGYFGENYCLDYILKKIRLYLNR